MAQSLHHITTEDERKKPLNMSEMFIDTGLSKDELNKVGIRVGTPIIPSLVFSSFKGKAIGKAFDDRVGCTVLLEIIKHSYLLHLFVAGLFKKRQA